MKNPLACAWGFFGFLEFDRTFNRLFFGFREIDIFRLEAIIARLIGSNKVKIFTCQETIAATTVRDLRLEQLTVLLIEDTNDHAIERLLRSLF